MPRRSFKPTAFARAHLRHQLRWRARAEHGDADHSVAPMWENWIDGVHPELRRGAAGVARGARLHSHAAALSSSMIFGLNLLLPFKDDASLLSPLFSSLVGEPFIARRIYFEWAPPARVLGELAGEAPEKGEPFTAIDALISGLAGGEPAAALVEVKLTEGGFTPCGGFTSPANQRVEVCSSAADFFQDPQACYLRRPRRARRERRYWQIFARAHDSVAQAFPGVDRGGRCPFMTDGQQIMRQHAAALGSVQDGLFGRTWLVLLHHDHNPDVTGPWQAYAAAAADRASFFRLAASRLLRAGHPHAGWMVDRYDLNPGT